MACGSLCITPEYRARFSGCFLHKYARERRCRLLRSQLSSITGTMKDQDDAAEGDRTTTNTKPEFVLGNWQVPRANSPEAPGHAIGGLLAGTIASNVRGCRWPSFDQSQFTPRPHVR